ncbi:glucuronate isomerase [Clostridium akagii]|uniref:glucuronate isomerase n=1 Tax=Clostridium akagii TaxID=91623 RepID=UPI00047D2462|nr:glucuronate isomerase [Clostridium akagii]
MRKFMDKDFLLNSDAAIKLFHNYAEDMPIIDYHCHVSEKEIFENKQFKNITEAWLYGDHYKWRAMRSAGIDEKYITGDATDYEKFVAYAKTVSMAIGNPLYHWTHLELQRFFGIYEVLNEKNAQVIWEKVNVLLKSEGYRTRDLIEKANVKTICTTDDPTDNLEYHIKLKEDKHFNVNVLPAFRPDEGLAINKVGFIEWIEKLKKVSDRNIENYDDFLEALESRAKFFHSVGCRISDHGLDYVPYMEATREEISLIFLKGLKGDIISSDEEEKYRTFTLIFLGKLYSNLGWSMELHINAQRDNSTKMLNKIGHNTGFDSIRDSGVSFSLSMLLNSLDSQDLLPKTIVYSLNPNDNYTIGALIGCFQASEGKGKIQLGAAWWFNDNKDGMIEQMKALGNLGLLSTFIGMLTDSRSFLSYTRHEYFRRILCNLIGEWVENGEIPGDMEMLGEMVQNICYNNAKSYLNI